jgi:hypothetical protein
MDGLSKLVELTVEFPFCHELKCGMYGIRAQ